ncbi:hypothetical protein [Vannielia litorea]|uniref:Uncharacterized protein n=1 Tax=Vannielia litorea TaxID=1217970 RepID=A0A1N6EW52_9RHOB|nr:hypothetical protein [Vannielia litorea]SIN87181.1 hypothetical protein SAMN05444002_1149 [Vannielia litorea]
MPPAPPPQNVFIKRASIVVAGVVLVMILVAPFYNRTRAPGEAMAAAMLHAFDGQEIAVKWPSGEIGVQQVGPGLAPYTMLCHRHERAWRGLMGTAAPQHPDAFECILRVAEPESELRRLAIGAIALPEPPPPEALDAAGARWLDGFVLIPRSAEELERLLR